MPVTFRCPSCFAPLTAAARLAGQVIACHRCKKSVTVPGVIQLPTSLHEPLRKRRRRRADAPHRLPLLQISLFLLWAAAIVAMGILFPPQILLEIYDLLN